jgi:sugar phosphate isomerase/epimerase
VNAGVMNAVLAAPDDAEAFRRAKRLGFLGVEVDVSRADLASTERLERLRRLSADTGLAIPSLVLGEHSDLGGIADRDPNVAAAARDDVERAVAWAAALGADLILVPFFGRAELTDDEDVARAADAFRPLCEAAGARGVTLCYEGTLPAAGIRALAARVASPWFGCYVDLANVVPRGMDTATEIRSLGSLIRRVHVKDVHLQVGDARPGLGRVDFDACARALGEIGYDGWLVLETPSGPPELVGRDLAFARSAFPALDVADDRPRLGIFTYEFGPGEEERLLETCRTAGLRTVQLGDPLLSHFLDRPDEIDSFVARLESEGITVAALAGYRNLIAPDPGLRRANVDFLLRCLELANRFGTSVVATETGTRNPASDWQSSPENQTPEAYAVLHDAVGELVAAAERHGAILALEASVKNIVGTYVGIEALLDRFPSEHLQLVLDPYNYASRHLLDAQARVTRDFLARLEPRFVLAHLKDVGEESAEVSTIEFGTGVFPQQPYVDFLVIRRPDLPRILEHLPLDHVPAAAERVRQYVSTTRSVSSGLSSISS